MVGPPVRRERAGGCAEGEDDRAETSARGRLREGWLGEMRAGQLGAVAVATVQCTLFGSVSVSSAWFPDPPSCRVRSPLVQCVWNLECV